MPLELAFALVAVLCFLAGVAFSRWERGHVIKVLRAERDALRAEARAMDHASFKRGELVGFKEGIREGVYLEREAWCDDDGPGGPDGDGEPLPRPLSLQELRESAKQDAKVRPIRKETA